MSLSFHHVNGYVVIVGKFLLVTDGRYYGGLVNGSALAMRKTEDFEI